MFGCVRGESTLDFQRKFAAELYDADKNYGDVIIETAGFVPLEVRFQKLVENGIQVRLKAQEFDSLDMRKLYLDEKFRVEPDDELEEIQTKLEARAEYLAKLKAQHSEAESKQDAKKSSNSEAKASESASDSAPSDD